MRTGVAAADALLGGKAGFAGAVRRGRMGVLTLDDFALTGAAAKLSGNARFDPASDRLAAALTLDIPRLKPLSAALGTNIAGAASAGVKAQGALDHLRLTSEIVGTRHRRRRRGRRPLATFRHGRRSVAAAGSDRRQLSCLWT